MSEIETTERDIEDFVRQLRKVRIPLEAVYSDEIDRIQWEEDAWGRNDLRSPLDKDC